MALQLTKHKWGLEHQERVKKKREKVRMMEALLAEYCRIGWDHPDHKGHQAYLDLRHRLGCTQTQLQNMGADVDPMAAHVRNNLEGHP